MAMVDYGREYGIDIDVLVMEGFGHPAAQWDNARIAERGEKFWEWYRQAHAPAPKRDSMGKRSKPRRVRKYSFTDEQMAIAMRSVRESR
jgi:hypothetical protein